jgi:hypothetical protein
LVTEILKVATDSANQNTVLCILLLNSAGANLCARFGSYYRVRPTETQILLGNQTTTC